VTRAARWLFLSALGGALACGGKEAAAPPQVDQVSVSPSRSELDVGESVRLKASAEDAAGNVLTDREARWLSDAPDVASVDRRGEVTGIAPGSATVTAIVDGKRGTARVTVTSPVVPLQISSVSPDPMVEGRTATITGNGFDPVASNNRLTIDAAAVPITQASATQLTFTVPAAECRPARSVAVKVITASNAQGTTAQKSVRPENYTTVQTGRLALVRDPSKFCLQFAPTASSEAYLVGVQSDADSMEALTVASVTATSDAAQAGAMGAMLLPERGETFARLPARQLTEMDDRILRDQRFFEGRIREQERAIFAQHRGALPSLRANETRTSALSFPPTLKVGDVVDMKVPNMDGNLCTDFTPIKAVVRIVAPKSVWLEDTSNPAGTGYTPTDLQTMSQLFDNQLYAGDVDYFGAPSDIDRNGRIAVVISRQVNKVGYGQNSILLGFVAISDLAPQYCPASNGAEVFYGRTPDAAGAFGAKVGREQMLKYLPFNIAHEFVHIIQFSHRIFVDPRATQPVIKDNVTMLQLWEAEGQATLAEEVTGHRLLGNTTGRNYGFNVYDYNGPSGMWYDQGFAALRYYNGWTSKTTRAPNAPEQCGWLEPPGANYTEPCIAPQLNRYGVGWLMLRWLSDVYGPAYPGGEKAMQHALIDRETSGYDDVSGLAGVPVDSLLAMFAAMQYVDDRISGADPRLTLASWNSVEILSQAYGESGQLAPRERRFGPFTDAVSVRGGSTAYFRISGAGRAGTAFRVRDPNGAPLPPHMRVWVVRLQ
jgi:hypothetical protein